MLHGGLRVGSKGFPCFHTTSLRLRKRPSTPGEMIPLFGTLVSLLRSLHRKSLKVDYHVVLANYTNAARWMYDAPHDARSNSLLGRAIFSVGDFLHVAKMLYSSHMRKGLIGLIVELLS